MLTCMAREKAVPILLYLSQKQPGDVDVLNNGAGLSQAVQQIKLKQFS